MGRRCCDVRDGYRYNNTATLGELTWLGALPFKGDNYEELFDNILHAELVLPPISAQGQVKDADILALPLVSDFIL